MTDNKEQIEFKEYYIVLNREYFEFFKPKWLEDRYAFILTDSIALTTTSNVNVYLKASHDVRGLFDWSNESSFFSTTCKKQDCDWLDFNGSSLTFIGEIRKFRY